MFSSYLYSVFGNVKANPCHGLWGDSIKRPASKMKEYAHVTSHVTIAIFFII